jgi:hypothetical protein
MPSKRQASGWTLFRAMCYAFGGFMFAWSGVWFGFIGDDYARGTFYLALSLCFDVAYWQMEQRYDLTPEAP